MNLNFKNISIFLIIFTLFISVSAVAASEIDDSSLTDNLNQSDDLNDGDWIEDIEEESRYEYSGPDFNDETLLDEGTANALSFTELQARVLAGGVVDLYASYKYLPVDRESFHGRGIQLAVPITIDGHGNIIDGSLESKIFRCSASEIVFKNIIFKNAMAGGKDCPSDMNDGGALELRQCTVTIENCKFINNQASNDGGAIFGDRLTFLNIKNTTFYRNTAQNMGGAIYTQKLNMSTSNFLNNTATKSGGAIYVVDYMESFKSYFRGNEASYGGGVFKENYEKASFHSDVFVSNTARSDGGGIFTDQFISIWNCSFKSNKANGEGGAIRAQALNVYRGIEQSVNDYCAFRSNNAKKGGAIYTEVLVDDENFDAGNLTYCLFSENVAVESGGAVYIDRKSSEKKITIKQCRFLSNQVTNEFSIDGGGAAIFITSNYMLLDDEGVVIEYNIFNSNTCGGCTESTIQMDAFQTTIRCNWWGYNTVNFTTPLIKIGQANGQDESYIQFQWDNATNPTMVNGGSTNRYYINVVLSNGLLPSESLFGLKYEFKTSSGRLTNLNFGITRASFDFTSRNAERNYYVVLTTQIDDLNWQYRVLVDVDNDFINPSVRNGFMIAGIVVGVAILGGLIYIVCDHFLGDDVNDTSNKGTGRIDDPFSNLQDAIETAGDGEIIYVVSGSYNITDLNITKNISIVSFDNTLVESDGNSRIFNIYSSKANIFGLTLNNGNSDNGGAIKYYSDIADCFINATFIGNNASEAGGAVYFAGSTSNVTVDARFINNTAQNASAMYFAKKSSDTLITDSLFLNTQSDLSGDIYAVGGVSLYDSWFGGNKTDSLVNVENVDVLSYLFLNPTLSGDTYEIGSPLTIDLNLYSYNPKTGSIGKYSKNRFDNLTLTLSSDTGSLSTNSVKWGEKFTFTPLNSSSRIYVTAGNVTTQIVFEKSDIGLSVFVENLNRTGDFKLIMSYNLNASGNVTFIIGNLSVFTTALNSTYILENIPSGSFNIIINYLGDKYFAPATSNITLDVCKDIIDVEGNNFSYPDGIINVDDLVFPVKVELVNLNLKKANIKKYANKAYVKATLKINSKPVKGVKLKFTFKNKTYTAKTDSNGIAKIVISKSILNKLKKGEKITYCVSYDKTTVKRSVVVK